MTRCSLILQQRLSKGLQSSASGLSAELEHGRMQNHQHGKNGTNILMVNILTTAAQEHGIRIAFLTF